MNPIMLSTKSGDAGLTVAMLLLVAAAMVAVVTALVRHARVRDEDEPDPETPPA